MSKTKVLSDVARLSKKQDLELDKRSQLSMEKTKFHLLIQWFPSHKLCTHSWSHTIYGWITITDAIVPTK